MDILFAVQSYKDDSRPVSVQRVRNAYAETEPPDSKTPVKVIGRPGVGTFATCGAGPVRGFYRLNDTQQLHITEWQDTPSFRGHVCLQVADFNVAFRQLKELGVIDTSPWGKVRRLRDGAMQMFARDPSGNLIELSHSDAGSVDVDILADELVERGDVFVSGRGDARGSRSETATLYHGEKR